MDMDFATSCPLVRPIAASYPVAVRQVAISLHASFRRSLAVPPLRFTRASPPSGCTGDFHPQAAGHAQHTGRYAPPSAVACGHPSGQARLHALTAAARGALQSSGRDEETALSRTKKPGWWFAAPKGGLGRKRQWTRLARRRSAAAATHTKQRGPTNHKILPGADTELTEPLGHALTATQRPSPASRDSVRNGAPGGWRVPAGGSPAQVRGSARLVVSVA